VEVGVVAAGARDVIADVTTPPTAQCSVCYGRQPTDWRWHHRRVRACAHHWDTFRMLPCLHLATTTGKRAYEQSV